MLNYMRAYLNYPSYQKDLTINLFVVKEAYWAAQAVKVPSCVGYLDELSKNDRRIRFRVM